MCRLSFQPRALLATACKLQKASPSAVKLQWANWLSRQTFNLEIAGSNPVWSIFLTENNGEMTVRISPWLTGDTPVMLVVV